MDFEPLKTKAIPPPPLHPPNAGSSHLPVLAVLFCIPQNQNPSSAMLSCFRCLSYISVRLSRRMRSFFTSVDCCISRPQASALTHLMSPRLYKFYTVV